jgi:penicillin-binding protein 1A
MAATKNNNQIKDIDYYKKKFWKIFFYGLGGFFLFFFASWGLIWFDAIL